MKQEFFDPWFSFCWPNSHIWATDNVERFYELKPGETYSSVKVNYKCLACGKVHGTSPRVDRGDNVLW